MTWEEYENFNANTETIQSDFEERILADQTFPTSYDKRDSVRSYTSLACKNSFEIFNSLILEPKLIFYVISVFIMS